jgi:hypothetical protein
MSWRLLLSEYPATLLSNEQAIQILVLLEWGGALTDQQLQTQLGIEKARLVSGLMALHKNKCIEYSSHFIKVSDRGRRLIDRFSLQSDILNQLLKSVPIPESSRHEFQETVSRFRNRAFDKYLESLFAMRSWSDAIKSVHFKPDVTSEDGDVGSLAILLRGLNHWADEDPQEQSNSSKMGEKMQKWIFTIRHHGSVPHPDSRTRMALEWLDAADASEKSQDPWTFIRQAKNASIGLFVYYNTCRNWLGTDEWRKEWSPQGASLAILQSCQSGSEAIHRLTEYGSSNWLTNKLALHHKQLGIAHETFTDDAMGQNLDDLFLKLISARTFEDLVDSLGLQESWVERLLTQIRDKCALLIQERVRKPDSAQPDTASERETVK